LPERVDESGTPYTNRKQQAQLEQTMREVTAHVPMQVVLIKQVDSWAMPGARVAAEI
jgi:hypothetical protein